MWHKRENVVSHLPKGEQATWRRRLQRAYDRPSCREAKAALNALHRELEQHNQSAAASLAEGQEETLTLHELGVYEVLGLSFKTTNCLESANALIEERCAISVEDVAPAAALARDRTAGHRAAAAARAWLPPSAEARGSARARAEDQGRPCS
jgi:transposase-like protein